MKHSAMILSLLMLLLTAGCASRGEIQTMQRQLDFLERSSVQTQDRIVLLDSLYRDAVERNITQQADMKLLLADLLDKSNIVDGRLTDIEARIAAILNRMDGGAGWQTPTTQVPADSTTDSAATTEALPQIDANKMFDNAFTDLKAGDYDLAIMQFQEYIALFGDAELTDDAQYWLGECYYGKKDYQKAIPEFVKVEKSYPKSDRLVSALYKLARSYQEVGEKRKARAVFERIVKDYPESFEAGPAGERLKEL